MSNVKFTKIICENNKIQTIQQTLIVTKRKVIYILGSDTVMSTPHEGFFFSNETKNTVVKLK